MATKSNQAAARPPQAAPGAAGEPQGVGGTQETGGGGGPPVAAQGVPFNLLVQGEVPPSPAGPPPLPRLGEVGKVLPIGFTDQVGTTHREFELREWTWDVEEELGDRVQKLGGDQIGMGEYVSLIVILLVERVGGIAFARLDEPQRRMVLRQMYMSDVVYMYIWSRLESIGHEMPFDHVVCPRCRAVQGTGDPPRYVADLRTLEVKVSEGPETRLVKLTKGIRYAGEVRSTVLVQPLPWGLMEDMTPDTQQNAAKFIMKSLSHGIREIPGAPPGPVVLSREHMMSTCKLDRARIMNAISEVGGGAVMEVRDNCRTCGFEFSEDLDWSHNNFFAISSL